MEIFKTKSALKAFLNPLKASGKKIALVPTMGALHNGHISLIDLAKESADIIICSIFVNPTQFTDPKDLEKYPRPIEHDLAMLNQAGCHGVFMPTVEEMYPQGADENWHIDLGNAEFLLEGAFRKGHYQGVTQIVKKLFDAVEPDVAMFGQKDFQQVLMIKNMVAYFNLPIILITCPIIREEDGLAMSSRNIHLTAIDRENSLVLSKSLQFVINNFEKLPLTELENRAKLFYQNLSGIDLDYFTIANGNTLEPAKSKNELNIIALVAAKVGSTRLIDNMIIR
ncbi:pantoate--beta-alanine ligase [Pedobacter sp. MC2016-05]|uniref:pantoate--beta-alanine ligase n=1 Tax=Pedobacter sp. MC2016-05 TaxID=2994474 RepID=UPI0022467B17|nr:pantoate--beta-alanine ligase [Pedobacter sp. MC2016-05]MCX2476370.1 pantoate--beta-alanine ligase [Pedobacter sp. MC2016-05]